MKRRWYEVVSFSPDGEEVMMVGEHKAYIRGPIDDLLILQTDAIPMDQATQIYQQAMTVLEMSGITRPVAMISSQVKLCRLRPVKNQAVIASLDARERAEMTKRATAVFESVEKVETKQ